MAAHVTVMKFGGTSLEDGPAFERVARVLLSHEMDGGPPPVAVVSAMSRVTDALMKSLRFAQEGKRESAIQGLEPHLERHQEVAGAFGGNAAAEVKILLDGVRQRIRDLLTIADAARESSAASRDEMLSYGEILSAQLLTIVLKEHGAPAAYVDARRFIKTSGDHGNARPLVEQTARHTQRELQPLLDQGRLLVLGGFIGSTGDGVTTTMGRGSSDYTATLVSAALNARETQIWTDVSGVHTADPALVQQARTIPHLSYDEAEEMARRGAAVLHQRMFEPLRAQQIPIRICNSHSPQEAGTLIRYQSTSNDSATQAIKAIAHKDQLVRIDLSSTPAQVANGFQRSVEAVLGRHHIALEVVARSSEGLSVACDEDAPLGSIVHELEQFASVRVTERRAAVTCVGEGLRSSSNGISAMSDILKDYDSTLVWQKTSSINLVSMVSADIVGPLVRSLHRELFEQPHVS